MKLAFSSTGIIFLSENSPDIDWSKPILDFKYANPFLLIVTYFFHSSNCNFKVQGNNFESNSTSIAISIEEIIPLLPCQT